jgi:hypothetical protein
MIEGVGAETRRLGRQAPLVAIINDIATIAQLFKNGIWLLGQVNLKTDVISNVGLLVRGARDATKDGDNGDKVYESSAVFLVIYYTSLAFLIGAKILFKVHNGGVIGEAACIPTLNLAVWGLEETAISTKNFLL